MMIRVVVIWIYLKHLSPACCLQLDLGDCPLYYEEPCSTNMVKFILSRAKNNVTTFHPLNPFELNLPEDFDNLAPVKILIHGYGGLGIDRTMTGIRDAYHEIGYTVILVDWGLLSATPCYPTAYLNTWHVSQCIAILAVSFIPFGVTPDNLHLIGFSLGAHIAGFTGANLKKNLGTLPGRITGLDPALPFFATPSNEWKLDSSDAKFVDIVHTSAGTFGKIETLGHVDFYMNGGVLQPACYNAPYPPLCSHVMSGVYFAESIKNEREFVGVECDNVASYILGFCNGGGKATMGEFVDRGVRGTYFIETSNSTPFALGFVYQNFLIA